MSTPEILLLACLPLALKIADVVGKWLGSR